MAAGFAPVKGTRHQAFDEVRLDDHGPVGDRRFCFVDVPRRRVLRTVQNPTLLALASTWDGHELRLTRVGGAVAAGVPRPTGERITCEYWGRPVPLELLDGPHAALVSAHLGSEVRLAAAPPGGVVYAAPVSLVSLASLAALTGVPADPTDLTDPADPADDRSALVAQARRFRPTLVLDGEAPWAEEGWRGRELRLGEAVIRVHEQIPRCAVVDLDPVTGRKSADLLKALASRPGELPFGVDAHVVRPGVIRPGDPASLES